MGSDMIGRYELKEQIGQGGMASVYRGWDPRFRRDVAIKLLPPEFLHDPTFKSRFEREAQTIAGLEHSAIVPVYDFGEHRGQPFLVMRYMTGGSLADRIEKGALSLKESSNVIDRVCAALNRAHQRGIVHRDIKPGNVLFDDVNDAYLSDFGIVKIGEATSQLTGSGIVGTPAYLAPEMMEVGSTTPLIDIYALGITLFQMLSGELPFKADTPMGVLMAHVGKPVPDIRDYRADLPPEIQTIIERAMAKQPSERYQSAGDLANDLQWLLNNADQPATQEQYQRITASVEPAVDTIPSKYPVYDAETVPFDADDRQSPAPATQVTRKQRNPITILLGAAGLIIAGLIVTIGLVLAGVIKRPAADQVEEPPPVTTQEQTDEVETEPSSDADSPTPIPTEPIRAEPVVVQVGTGWPAWKVPANEPFILRYGGWVTAAREYAENNSENMSVTLTIDGRPVSGSERTAISGPDENGYYGFWNTVTVQSLSPGEHPFAFTYVIDESITDGFDNDGDGAEDYFGPGENVVERILIAVDESPQVTGPEADTTHFLRFQLETRSDWAGVKVITGAVSLDLFWASTYGNTTDGYDFDSDAGWFTVYQPFDSAEAGNIAGVNIEAVSEAVLDPDRPVYFVVTQGSIGISELSIFYVQDGVETKLETFTWDAGSTGIVTMTGWEFLGAN